MSNDFPLSSIQSRLWFLDRLMPANALYNVPAVFDLRGPIEPGCLDRALETLTERHPILRARFTARGDEPAQSFDARGPELELSDRRAAPEPAAWEQVRQLVTAPFDLAAGRLARAGLIRTGDDTSILVLVAHHIICDGWSMGVLCAELGALYTALSRGEPPPLPPPPAPYQHYARWQRQPENLARIDRQLDYWRRSLAGAPQTLDLPTAEPRPDTSAYTGRLQPVSIDPELTLRLRELGKAGRVTLFMTLLAAWQVLLARCAGSDDITTGVPVDGRWRWPAAGDGVVGPFVNTLVMRGDLSGAPTFETVLDRVRWSALDAYGHQDVPFERLVRELRPERLAGHNPFFQNMFALNHAEPARFDVPGVEAVAVNVDAGTAKFDLSLSLEATERDGIDGTLCSSDDRFHPAAAEQLIDHFRRVLDAVADDPAIPIARIDLLTATERRRVLANRDTRSRGSDRPLSARVWDQARRTPDAVAVECAGLRLTYRELEERAGRLAARLRELRVGPGQYVPVLMPPGVDLPVVYLAVLEAGAAFVPLSDTWPTARVEMVLWDTSAGLVVTDRHRPGLDHMGVRQVVIGTDGAPPAPVPAAAVRPAAGDPVYVIYTSGSTGKPKGAAIAHRGLANRLAWMDDTFGPESAATILQTTQHVFDSSVWQILWPLTHGGRTIIPDRYDALDIPRVIDAIEWHRVSMINFVPSVFGMLVEHLQQEPASVDRLASLHTVIVGGEALRAEPARTFRALLPGSRLVNVYGPTEATIGCITHPIEPGQCEPVPIGRPIAGVGAVLLDPDLRPVPPGHPGELCLAGACLGIGYVNDAEATARAFPTVDLGPGWRDTRIYRTGDLARLRDDGNLEFLGRLDHQVKLHGHRIELGEIEAALASNPAVRAAAATVHDSDRLGRRLVGYVVPIEGGSIDLADVTATLRHWLPDSMLPSVIVELARLPLTANGKLDRDALPPPADPVRTDEQIAPRTDVERALAAIWADLLGVEDVGVHDGFFELGGHSLLAVKLASRIGTAFDRRLPLRWLFDHDTIAEVAVELASPATATTERPTTIVPTRRVVYSGGADRARLDG